jgi:predicted alpha/beta-fold hydrolase
MPFTDLSTTNLKFLNSDQALSDIKNFLQEEYKKKPFKKVVLNGCSYAGGLVGWYAEENARAELGGASFV